MTTLRKLVIAGLLVWLPLAATIIIVKLVIDLLDKTILLLPPEFRPENVLGFSIPGFGLIFAIAVLLFTGIFAANFFGRQLVGFWENLLGRIPLVRSIYTSVKQVSTTLLTSDSNSFRKAVLVEYPRKGIWSIGFLTNQGLPAACGISGEQLISVFVPTTPNPTSGFIVMLPQQDVQELDMTVEEGFKFIISMGVVIPEDKLEALQKKPELAQSEAAS
ncbi:MAG: DUF502 domain-containing protein [Thiotrichales bacterium]|nr:DUF502 domain-containing protein [Thiotrichales bacterium]